MKNKNHASPSHRASIRLIVCALLLKTAFYAGEAAASPSCSELPDMREDLNLLEQSYVKARQDLLKCYRETSAPLPDGMYDRSKCSKLIDDEKALEDEVNHARSKLAFAAKRCKVNP